MIRDFRISQRVNPIGLDEDPRFSWKLESDKNNVMQKSYQILVICGGKMAWDSGIVVSEESTEVQYEGVKLSPMTEYQVQVNVWDSTEEMSQANGFFETGLLVSDNFNAKWISHDFEVDDPVCAVFEKEFIIERPIRAARLYATACGLYEAEVNGTKAGDIFLAPGWTSYHSRIEYQTYDITELLKDGKNKLSITVGNGWYKGYLGFDERPNIYGNRTAVRGMVCVEFTDGTRQCFGTDKSFSVTTGPIASSEIYYGETQNFNLEKRAAISAVEIQDTSSIGTVVGQESEPVRITKRFSVIEKIITPKGEVVFDFGQNMAGFVEVVLPELEGEQLKIRHAETLDKDGNFYTENLRTAISEDVYIYGKEQVGKVARPHFTFHGFRYICVEGCKEDISAENFTACAIHSDMKETGSFISDNPLVNQLQSNIQWGQRGNFVDVPTDCPQRNERLGWTGDAQVFCGTASYNFNTALFFRKWLRDMAAESNPTYGVPHVVPNILGNQDGAAAWSDSAVIIPWKLYETYGSKEMLREQYPLMKLWVDFVTSKTNDNGLWQDGFQYGDWLALDIESGSTDRTGGTDKYLVANAYYAYSTGLVCKAAAELGYTEEAAEYETLHSKIIDAMNDEFITKTGRLVCETQTACVLMLHFHIAKPEYRERILKTLENNINLHHGHLTTGFVGTPYLCHCLSENGLHELASEIFNKEDFPGWFYAVKKGATTIWERWNSIMPDGSFDESGMNSLNHYAYGCIGSWLYEKAAGISPAAVGYKKIIIEPKLTKGMTEVSAEFDCVYGRIKSAWICRDGKITVDITIPANTTAVIRLPENEEELYVGSGDYHYEYETETRLESEPFTMESTLGDIAAEELGKAMIEQAIPGFFDTPMIQYAFAMTLSELLVQGPEAKPLYEAVIKALNEQKRNEKSANLQ